MAPVKAAPEEQAAIISHISSKIQALDKAATLGKVDPDHAVYAKQVLSALIGDVETGLHYENEPTGEQVT